MPDKPSQQILSGLVPSEPCDTSSRPEATSPRDETQSADSLKDRTVYLVDAHSLIFQVFHALPEMTSPLGQPVNAVYGFTRDILYLLEEKKPDYLFCAFDLPGKTFRHQVFEEYKAHRDEMPESLRPQMASIRRLLGAMDIPVLDRESYEADDVAATVSKSVDSLGGQCVIVTSDKDCRQLLSDRVSLYNLRKDETFNSESLKNTWGIRPDQVVDFQALVGDAVDNVPGVPLIGPKIASELLQRYETLDNVLQHADEISGKKRRQNLIDFRDQALVSRQLVKLVDDVPVEIDWNSVKFPSPNGQELLELFHEFGFRTFAEKLGTATTADVPSTWEAEYETAATPEQLSRLIDQMSRQNQLSLDTETTDVNPRRAKIVGYSFAWQEGEAYYVPVRAPAGDPCLDPDQTLESLRGVLEDPRIEKIGQNLKYDMVVLRSAGVQLQGVSFDTMIGSYLLEAGARNHNLDDLAKRYLNHETIKISHLIGTGKKQIGVDGVPVAQVAAYAAENADVALRLVPVLASRLEQDRQGQLFRKLEIPLVEVLAELEFNGIRVDVERLKQLSHQYGERMEQLERDIYRLAGGYFNIASPRQLGEILFQRLGLPVLKKMKTGPSTDAEVLEQLARLHELPAKVMEFRQYAKLRNTYVDALPELVNLDTGRIHTSFNQVVTATGRLSSADPNLQNIPVRTQTSREIRSAFRPGLDDWRLLAADYSQIELRVLAHFSGDETLLTAFVNDEDIHARVASEVYEMPLEEVTSEMRRHAKAINFGVIYGQSPFGLAKSVGIETSAAAEFIDAYFARYTGVDEFFKTLLAQCRENGYVSTILGRRRKVQGVRDPSRRGDSRQRNLPERTAINTVIQGSAADLIKQAMINVFRRMRREESEARMLLQIHDELVFEVPSSQVNTFSELVIAEMSNVGQLSVPLKVDVKSGCNWADCEPLA